MAKNKPNKAASIRSLIKAWDESFRDNNLKYYKNQDFVLGNQWDAKEKRSFGKKNKVALTFNVVAPLANHVIAEQRQSTPNIVIEATDDTPQEVATIRSALVKDIAFNSRSTVVFQNSFERSLVSGYGVWEIGTKYRNARTFEQEIEVRDIERPTKAYFDIGAKMPEKVDGMFSGYREEMTRRRFISLYGKGIADKIGYTDYDTYNHKSKNPDQSVNNSQSKSIKESEGGSSDILSNEKYITVIYHYERKNIITTLYELSDEQRTTLTSKELNKLQKYTPPTIDEEGNELPIDDEEELPDMYILNGDIVTVLRTRDVPDDFKIVHSVWGGDYELESTVIPCKCLPLVFLDQHSYTDKEGKQQTFSFFEHAKDPQRFLNLCKSQAAYIMMTTRYDQFIGTPDMIASAESAEIWADPSNHQGLLTADRTKDGTMPIQLTAPPFPDQLLQQASDAMLNIQYCTGIYDTQLGNQGDVVSGIASDRQSRKGSKNTFVARDNVNRAIAVTAEIINEMIPTIYDSRREVRLNLPDKGMQSVILNDPQSAYEGMPVKNDMTQGEYKIKLIAGPSTEESNADNIQSWDILVKASPQAATQMMDLIAKSLPLSEDKITVMNRYRALIDPKIITAGETGQAPPQGNQPPDPNELAAQLQMQQIQMQAQKNQSDFQVKMQELALKEADLKLKALTAHQDMTLEFEKIDTEKREAEAKAAEVNTRFQAEIARIEADERIAHHNNIKDIVTSGYTQQNNTKPQNTERR